MQLDSQIFGECNNHFQREEFWITPCIYNVAQITNNLSSCNLPSMVEQFSESVEDIYLPWVAVYLVERASIEPNLHTLYLRFLDHLADSSLYS